MARRLAVLAGLSVALLAGPAFAGGGDRIPAPIPVPAPMPVQESFSHYLRADFGWGFSGEPSYSESGAEYGPTPLVYGDLTGKSTSSSDVFHGSFGAGTYWTPHFRTDVTLDLRGAQDIDATATYVDGAVTAATVRERISLRGTVGLFNAFWDLTARGSFTPYVGAGVGFVYNQIDRTHYRSEDTGAGLTPVAGIDGTSGSANNFGLAAALMAGMSFSWGHGWVLDMGYRALYMDGGDVNMLLGPVGSRAEIGSQWEHQVRVGLRANIW